MAEVTILWIGDGLESGSEVDVGVIPGILVLVKEPHFPWELLGLL